MTITLPKNAVLPEWAKLKDAVIQIPVIDVDTDAAYIAFLTEYATLPAVSLPPVDEGGRPKSGAPVEVSCDASDPDQYWLEVCYQSIKLELQLALRMFTFEARLHDRGKKWAQSKYPLGRGPLAATEGKEARQHFKRLRGMLPG